MLQQLIRLASDRSPESRTRLLHAVTELYMAQGAPSVGAGEHYSSIASAVLPRLPDEDRASYARRVAAARTLPREIAKALATDPNIAVARDVLRLSQVLSDGDLIGLLSSLPTEHMVAVAERPALSEGLTDALVGKGDRQVLRAVSGNDGAKLSFASLTTLLKYSETDAALARNLMKRVAHLPTQQAKQLRAPLAPQTAFPATPLPALTPGARLVSKKRQADVKSLIQTIRAGSRSADDVAELLASEDRAFDLARVIGALTSQADGLVLKALLDSDPSAIAQACRSAGLEERGFRAILSLRGARLNQSAKQLERDLAEYLKEQMVA